VGQVAAGRPWHSAMLHCQVLLNPATAHALTLAAIGPLTFRLQKNRRVTINSHRHSAKYLIIFFIAGLLVACSGQKKYFDFGQVRNGNYLDEAKEVPLDTFLTVWLENTYPVKVDINLNELYRDTVFTYFGKQTLKNQTLFKIKNKELVKVDYKSLSGDSIRSKFYNEIIPTLDKEKGKGKNCKSTYTKIDFKYKFIASENAIEVKCHYKVTCEFIARLIKSDYLAKYDLINKTFIKS
jgi:hypothetical protein